MYLCIAEIFNEILQLFGNVADMVKVELVVVVEVVDLDHDLQLLQVGEVCLHKRLSEWPKWMMS
jgi:hypothetical protein